MAMDIDDDVESLVREAMDAICSGEYNLGHVTDDCSYLVDLGEIKILALLLLDANANWQIATPAVSWPVKQHTDNTGSQPTYGRKIRDKFNAQHVYAQTHLPTLAHTHTTHIHEIIFLNYFYLQALHRVEEHLMLITQERSLYRNEFE